jgi:shikimate kinase
MPTDRRTSIVLIGYRGCGKTTVGRLLADILGLSFVDTDALVVEEAGCAITAIFESEGETGFRERESRAIERALVSTPVVISLGGGAVTVEPNMVRLASKCMVVWLTASPEVLCARAAADVSSAESRPALTSLSGIDEVRQVLAVRTPLYTSCADVTIDTENRKPIEIAREIAEVYAERLQSE